MSAIDEQKRMYNIGDAYVILFKKIVNTGEECGLSEEKRREGYMLVPRVSFFLNSHWLLGCYHTNEKYSHPARNVYG